MIITKRDGTIQPYHAQKIIDAIVLSGASESTASMVEQSIRYALFDGITVQEIEKLVELYLMDYDKAAAREYIQYRSARTKTRDLSSGVAKAVFGLVDQTDETIMTENANKSSKIVSTHRDLIAGVVSKELAKSLIPEVLYEYHRTGRCHYHDLDYVLSPLTNCGVYNYEGMMKHGFVMGNAEIETPHSLRTATTVLTQIALNVSNASYGGQSVHEIDSLLAPYADMSYKKNLQFLDNNQVLAERLTLREIDDAMQSLIYQINSMTGANGQSAFYTHSLGRDTTYWGRKITEAYLRNHMNGLGGKHKVPVFPKVIFLVDENINQYPGTRNYDLFQLAMQCTAKTMYPDYVSVKLNMRMTGADKPTTQMGCRSFLPAYKENGEYKVVGRFNLGVASVNVAMAAAEAGGDVSKFFEVLEEYCDAAYEFNMWRIRRMEHTKASANPIMWMHGALARLDADEEIGKLFYNGNASCSIGYIGIAEAMKILGIETRDMGLRIIKFIKNLTIEYTNESGIAFSPYGTPAESLCGRAAQALRKEYPEFDTGDEFLTNSFHLHVSKVQSIFQKLDYEADFYMYSSGGNVDNIEVPCLRDNIPALEKAINYAMDRVNYLIVNTPVDACYKCGFEGEFTATAKGYHCPKCGNSDPTSICVMRRVSGYISEPPMRPFNVGKQSEVLQRVKMDLKQ